MEFLSGPNQLFPHDSYFYVFAVYVHVLRVTQKTTIQRRFMVCVTVLVFHLPLRGRRSEKDRAGKWDWWKMVPPPPPPLPPPLPLRLLLLLPLPLSRSHTGEWKRRRKRVPNARDEVPPPS